MALTKVHSRHMRLRRGAQAVILLHVVNGSGVPSMFEIFACDSYACKSEARCLVPWLVSVDFYSLFLLENVVKVPD